MGQIITQLAVKILFCDSTGFDEMRRIIYLPEKQKLSILYMNWIRMCLDYLYLKGTFTKFHV